MDRSETTLGGRHLDETESRNIRKQYIQRLVYKYKLQPWMENNIQYNSVTKMYFGEMKINGNGEEEKETLSRFRTPQIGK